MLAIKLSKVGKTNKKMFRLIISEKGRDPYGNVLEILGSYNPHSKELVAQTDRIKYWLSQGAKMTATINNLLVEKKIIDGSKVTASKPGKSQKNQEKKEEKPEKKVEEKIEDSSKESTPVAPEAPAETNYVLGTHILHSS